MHFCPNTFVSITEVTRYFRVLNTDLETWCEEGVLPPPVWMNGRRYWSSNDLNDLIDGCAAKQRPKALAKIWREDFLDYAILSILFALVLRAI